MSRLQDSVIDDDEECCPLCIEEFDLSDKNFRPCPCGYQICQFCYNSLKITYEKSNCPNCRRPYDEKTIQYKIPTAEEFKLDQQAKNRKQAAARRKETEKKEVETSSRRNLAGVRVKQQNLVYVIGLVPDLKDEPKLLQTLRGKDYFGQYGDIEKIVVSKAKPGQTNQGVGVYVTFARKEDAAVCINAIDGTKNEDRLLRAQYGTTKYCSAYLRGEDCNNKNCSFLHETGEEGQDSNLQNEQITGKVVTKPIGTVPIPTRPAPVTQGSTSQPMLRQPSSDTADSRKGSNFDSSALPSTANWGNAITTAPTTKSRRASQVTRPSPQITMAVPTVKQPDDVRTKETKAVRPQSQSRPQPSAQTINAVPTSSKSAAGMSTSKETASKSPLDGLMEAISSGSMSFVFNESAFTRAEMAAIERHPNLIDPYGGAKMRLREDKEAAVQAKSEAELAEKLAAQEQAQSEQLPIDTSADDDNVPAGSLALGGEPEEDTRNSSARGTIQRPTQPSSATNFINDQFATMNGTSRSLTPQQRQQLTTLSGIQQAPGLGQPHTMLGSDAFEFDRRGAQFGSQSHYDSTSGHLRQGSRYFNPENKPTRNQAASYYTSGVQGPPPGLKTAGTPPFSGGATFAHGQGFTSNVNTNFGAKDLGTDYTRGRAGAGVGLDMSKRGVVDHADPNALQSRLHPNGAGAGQGLFGGQNQDDEDFPALPARRYGAPPGLSGVSSVHTSVDLGARSSATKAAPGLSISHAHPSPSEKKEAPSAEEAAKVGATGPGPIAPAVPLLPIGQVAGTPKSKAVESDDERKKRTSTNEVLLPDVEHKPEASAGIRDISLGSPKPKRTQTKVEPKQDLATEVKPVSDPAIEDGIPAQVKDIEEDALSMPKAPGMIENPTTGKDRIPQEVHVETGPDAASDITEMPSEVTSSQPGTPTTPSRATAIPRALRVVPSVPKQADATPASATTERSSGMPPPSRGRQHSRRPSVSSISHTRSSTPAMSEAFSFGASRASSPPPGIVGSAPERTKTKAQQRKERKEKSRQTADGEQASGTTTPAVEEVAPVVSRQRKQKKRVESSVVSDNATKSREEDQKLASATQKESSSATAKTEKEDEPRRVSTKPKRQDSKKSSAPPTPKEFEPHPSPLILEPLRPKWTLRDFYSYAAKHPEADVQTLLNTHVSSMAEILTCLTSTKDIEPSNPLFNPPPLSSYRLPADSRRGADYLDANGYTDSNPFGMLYLTQDKKRAIQNGHAVRISDASKPNDLLRRAMVSPTGTVWRHLNEAEEERVLELEERREVYAEEWGAMGLGLMDKLTALEEDDYMNLEGGMERLSVNGDAHGVSWVMRDDEDDEQDAGDENEDELEYDEDDEDITDDDDLGLNVPGGWETGLALGTVPENVNITNKANVLPPMRLVPNEKSNLKTMDVDRLVKRIAEAQKEVEAARKEMEKIEKNLLKKNKEASRWREVALKVT